MTPRDFSGRRVLAFESRRSKEIGTLIETFGGRPLLAPAVREASTESDEAALAFGRAVEADDFDVIVFLTGVGVRSLLEIVERAGRRDAFVSGLSRVRVAARGPKPLAVLRGLGVPVWVDAPEPNTWRELLSALDQKVGPSGLAGQRIAVQEYGATNADLLSGLRDRGALVTPVRAYEWALPEDVEPLRAAARAAAAGEVDVVLVTSGIQIVHFWQIVTALELTDQVRHGLRRAVIASIGPASTEELRRHGFEPAFEPTHPKMGLLVREAAVWGRSQA